jgi:Recombinational DNA repair protein (RecF pathway)
MTGYAPPIRRLIEELSKFPGIGEKTATRLAAHILRASDNDAKRLAESITGVKKKSGFVPPASIWQRETFVKYAGIA